MKIKDHKIEDIAFLESPNFNDRPDPNNISLIVIHSISLPSRNYNNDNVESFFLNNLDISKNEYFKEISDLKVSSHLYIKRSGRIIQFVPFDKRAWHAGISNYKGEKDCNDFSIGIELEGLVPKKLYGNTLYQDPIEKSNHYASHLKKSLGCDLVICLSHLGFKYKTKKVSDKILASQSKHIDLIIGGHTHTFLNNPVFVEDLDKKKVQIAQVGWAGINIGRIDYFFNQKMCVKKVEGSSIFIKKP